MADETPFVTTQAAFERFAGAARAFVDAVAKAGDATRAAATHEFNEFLREQSLAMLPVPWAGKAALALARAQQDRWQFAAAAAARAAEAQGRLQHLCSAMLGDAARSFVARCAAQSRDVMAPAGLRSLHAEWIDHIEAAYAQTARSDAFCGALADLVNAGSAWRRELAATLDEWAKQLDLPTRSELNSMQLQLKALEEKVRSRTAKSPAAKLRSANARPRRAKRQPAR